MISSPTPQYTVTVNAALRRGHFLVNGPVVILLLAGFLTLAYAINLVPAGGGLEDFAKLIAAPVGMILAIVPAWIWWSVTVPKWRLWALENVDDWPKLKRRAIATGLIWPDGSIFARTEIKSARHARAEHELEQRLRAN